MGEEEGSRFYSVPSTVEHITSVSTSREHVGGWAIYMFWEAVTAHTSLSIVFLSAAFGLFKLVMLLSVCAAVVARRDVHQQHVSSEK